MNLPLRVRSSTALVKPVAVFAAAAALTALTACSAGQITQTDTKQTAITGVNTSVGHIEILDAAVMALPSNQRAWEKGQDVPLTLTVVNTGRTSDSLQKVTSPLAESVTLVSNPYDADTPNSDEEGAATAPPPEEPPTESSPTPTPENPGGTATPNSDSQTSAEPSTEEDTPAQDNNEGSAEAQSANFSLDSDEIVSLDGREQYLLLQNITEELTPRDTATVQFHFDANGTGSVKLPLDHPLTPYPRASSELDARDH